MVADHGTDPTAPGTDHTREYVPLLIMGEPVKSGIDVGTRDSFSDLAATLADYFNLDDYKGSGTSMWETIKK